MNETFQAREGMPPSLFPDGVPTYMGHYHKPHTVGNTNIRYVGSPYQGAAYSECRHVTFPTRVAFLPNRPCIQSTYRSRRCQSLQICNVSGGNLLKCGQLRLVFVLRPA